MQNKTKSLNLLQATAANSGLVSCHTCHKLSPVKHANCSRCGTLLHQRRPNSIQITLSFLVTAILLYIPANIFPIMTTQVLGESTHSTIIGGVVLFIKHGSYFIAAIIFIASIVVPIAKMAAIFWLCCATKTHRNSRHLELTRLYRLTEFVGKWSMVDVFVVAILVALIQVDNLMSIKPGIAALAFSSMVIFTMLSAKNFDIRLIWDKLEDE